MAASGMVTVNPTADTTYTLTATSAGTNTYSEMRTLTVNVDLPLEPAIGSFSGTTPITEGETAILTWTTTNAESVTITAVDGNIPDEMVASGMVEVMPTATTTYTLTATGAQTTPMTTAAMQTTTVTVNRAPPAVITSFAGPAGSVAFGSDVALRWTTTNAVSVAIVADSDAVAPMIPEGSGRERFGNREPDRGPRPTRSPRGGEAGDL